MDPTKLKYILERAADDEKIELGERLQRGELSDKEAEALRTSQDSDEAVLHELYRPLDELEKARLLRAKKSPNLVLPLAVAAAAALLIVCIARPLRPPPLVVAVASQAAQLRSGQHALGVADKTEKPIIDIGGCTVPVLSALAPSDSVPADAKVMVFFQRGTTLVPWPIEFQHSAESGTLTPSQVCARVPAAGLEEGDWQLAVIYGRTLPAMEKAKAALLGSYIPPWSRWDITRKNVLLRRVPK